MDDLLIVVPYNRPDLPSAEESGRRHPEDILQRRGIVVRDLEHVRATAVAGEQQGAGRPGRAERLHLEAEARPQVLVRGRAVAKVHTDGLPDPYPLAERDRARLAVGGDDRTYEEVAAPILRLVLVDHDPQHQAGGGKALLTGVEGIERLAEPLDRRPRGEFLDHMPHAARAVAVSADGLRP